MQVLSSLRSAKNRHPDCKVVRRKGRIYVICKPTRVLKRYRDVRKSVNFRSVICRKAPLLLNGAFFMEKAEVSSASPSS